MSGIGLSKVINGDFLRRLGQLGSRSSSSSNPFKSQQGTSDSVGVGLRIGARTFSTAIDGLSAATSLVNLSEEALNKLKDVTGKLIKVTEQASKISTSQGTRTALDQKFHQLAGEFRNIVKNSTTGTNEFLSKDGLSEIFKSVGLDEKSSDSIAAIFSSFITPSTDSSLASEFAGVGSENIPVGAFVSHDSDQEYTPSKLTNSGITAGAIASGAAVFLDNDTILGQNPSFKSILTVDQNGSYHGQNAGSVTDDVTLLAVNEANGYSLVKSHSDFLGFNAGGYDQIFLVDNVGNVVHQYTTNASDAVTYTQADVSSNNQSILFVQSDSDLAEESIVKLDVATLGVDPDIEEATITVVAAGSTSAIYSKVAINNSGSFGGYVEINTGHNVVTFVDLSDLSADAFIAEDASIEDFGFIRTNGIAVSDGNVVKTYLFGSGNYTTVIDEGETISQFATLEQLGTIGIYSVSSGSLGLYTAGGSQRFEYAVAGGDVIQSISIAANGAGTKPELGVVGTLSGVSGGDTDIELYRFSYNRQYSSGKKFNRSTPAAYDAISGEQANSIFDDDRHITNRGEAYRALSDLKQLQKQIDGNISALQSAKSTIEDNIKLLRASGRAFLEASDRLDSASDAESLAQSLQSRIRALAPGSVLAQAENLSALTVAALTNSSS